MSLTYWNVAITEEPTPKEAEEGSEGRVILEPVRVQAPTRELAIIAAVQTRDGKIAINSRVRVQVSPF